MATLSIRNVSKRFGETHVLKGIDLDLEDGEFLVLVGPSGCGKSTLLNLIAGLESATDGELLIGDTIVNDIHPKDRNIAMVFQSYALYPTMTVRKNITFGMEIRRTPKAEQEEALARVSKLLQIDALLDRKPGQLSGGQRQRVAMGRALVRDPDIFLFDEPLSNLDAKLRVEMRTEIKKLHQRLGRTIVYVTHDQIEAMTLASRIALMNEGVIQQYADPQTIYEDPSNMFVAGFVGSPPMNFVPATLVGDGAQPALSVRDGGNGGGELRLPLPQPPEGWRGWHGRAVVLGIRPENIVTRAEAESIGTGGFGAIERTVEMVEPTGADTMLLFPLGEIPTIARLRPQDAVAAGEKMPFMVNMNKACLFDPETTRRL